MAEAAAAAGLVRLQCLAQGGLRAHAEDDPGQMWDAAGALRQRAPRQRLVICFLCCCAACVWGACREHLGATPLGNTIVQHAEAKEVLGVLGASSHPTGETELAGDLYDLFWEVHRLAAELHTAPDRWAQGCWHVVAAARRIEEQLQAEGRIRAEVLGCWATSTERMPLEFIFEC